MVFDRAGQRVWPSVQESADQDLTGALGVCGALSSIVQIWQPRVHFADECNLLQCDVSAWLIDDELLVRGLKLLEADVGVEGDANVSSLIGEEPMRLWPLGWVDRRLHLSRWYNWVFILRCRLQSLHCTSRAAALLVIQRWSSGSWVHELVAMAAGGSLALVEVSWWVRSGQERVRSPTILVGTLGTLGDPDAAPASVSFMSWTSLQAFFQNASFPNLAVFKCQKKGE